MTPEARTGTAAKPAQPRADGSTRPLAIRAFRYGTGGLITTAVYFGAVTLLVELASVAPVPAAAAATAVVLIVSYAFNRRWVFETNRSHVSAAYRYVVATIFSMALNTAVMYLCVRVSAWPYWTGLAFATVLVPPTNFAINYLWCFRQEADRGS